MGCIRLSRVHVDLPIWQEWSTVRTTTGSACPRPSGAQPQAAAATRSPRSVRDGVRLTPWPTGAVAW